MASYAAESERLWLELLDEKAHLHGLHEIMNQTEGNIWSEYSTHTPTITLEDTKALVLRASPTPDKPWNTRYAVLLRPEYDSAKRETPKMIGIIGTPREADVGYRMNHDYWGRGFMSEALALFLKMFWELDENKKYDKIIAAADTENGASLRVLEKAGLIKGELRKEFYERAIFAGVKKSDLQFYYQDRPIDS